MYFTFATHNHVFQSLGVWGPGTASITGLAQPEQVNTAEISGGMLETLNVPALQGQWLTAADQDTHGLGRVMLSYGYWQRRFGGDPAVVGRSITVNSQTRVIAGVMPRGFKIVNYDFDLLVPMALDPTNERLAGFSYRGIARLRPGVNLSQANADSARLLNVWMDSWTNGPGSDPHWYTRWKIAPALEPLKNVVVGSVQTILWVVMATIGVVMLIACTNVANLTAGESRCTPAGTGGALSAGRGPLAHCTRAFGRERHAGAAGRSSGRGCGLRGAAVVDRHRAGELATSERDFARRKVNRLHAGSLGAFRFAFRCDTGAALCTLAAARGPAWSCAHDERQPRPTARP